jgi:hypothetical protein
VLLKTGLCSFSSCELTELQKLSIERNGYKYVGMYICSRNKQKQKAAVREFTKFMSAKTQSHEKKLGFPAFFVHFFRGNLLQKVGKLGNFSRHLFKKKIIFPLKVRGKFRGM